MAGLHFDATYNNADVMRKVRECEKVFAELGNTAEIQGKRIDAAFEKISLKSLERMQEIMKNFPKEVQGISSFQRQIDGLEKHIERVNQRIASVGNGKLGSTFSDVSGNVNIGNVLKEQVYVGAQAVNTLSEKIIQQKILIKDIEHDVRTLGEAYKRAGEGTTKGNALFANFKEAKAAVQEEKNALFELQTQQAQARLSVRKLKDEQSLYQKETQKVVESNESMSVSFKKALGVIGGVAALKQLGSEIIKVRGEFQAMQTAIETLVGKEMAGNLIPQIKELAKVSPLTLSDMVGAEKMMLGFNIKAEDTIRYLQALGDISMGNSQKFNSLTLAFSQMSATGKLMGQDLNQMINAGFNPLQTISVKTGKSIATLKEEMSKGAISTEMVQKAFIDATSAGGKFFGMSENASKTINGQLSMMQDALDEVFNEIGTKGEGAIMSGIQATTSLIQNYETVGKILTGLVVTYGVYRTALITNIALTHSWAVAARVDAVAKGIQTIATKAQAIAQLALNSAMKANPYVLAATLVVGVASAMWALHDGTTAAEKAQDSYNKKVEDAAKKAQDHKQKLEGLISELQDEVTAETRKMEVLDKIKRGYPSLFQKFIDEKGHVKDLTAAWKAYNEEASKNKAIQNKTNASDLKQSIDDMKRIQEVFNKNGYDFKSYTKSDLSLYQKYKPYETENLKENIEKSERELWKWEKEVRDDEFTQWKVDLKGKTDAQIEASRAALVKRAQAANGDKHLLAALGKRIVAIDEEKNNRKANDVTYGSDFDKAKTEWETAKKELDAIEKDKDKYTRTQYDNAKKREETAQKAYKDLGGVTNTSKQDKAADTLRKEQEKLTLLMDKQALDQSRSAEDLQNQVDQARINAMDEGSKKTLAQMELNFEKEMQAIDRQKEDLLRKKVEDERAKFDKKEDENAAKDPKYKKQTFDPTGIVLSDGENKQFDELYKAQIAEKEKEEKAYLDNLLEKHQDYTDKRLAIEKKFNADIAALDEQRKKAVENGDTQQIEQLDRAKAQATKNKGMELMGMDYDKLKESPDYVRAFENLKETSSETLNSLLTQLENAKQTAAQVLSPDQLREYTTTIQEIMDELDSRNPFQALSDKKKELAEAEQELADAQMSLENAKQTAEAVKGGAKIENGVSSKFNEKTGKIESTKEYLTEAQALEKVKDKTNEYNKAKDNVVKTDSKVKTAEKNVKAQIDELSNAMSDLGSAIGGQAGEIISLIGDIGSFTMFAMEGVKAAADTSATAISTVEKASVILAVISAAVQVATKIAKLFKGESDEEKRQREIEHYNKIIAIYDKIIEKQKESIKFGYGFSAIRATEKAMKDLNKQTEYYRKIAKDNKTVTIGGKKDDYLRALGDLGLEANDDILTGFYTSELAGLSSKQLEYIRDNYKELWASLKTEQRDALQAIIDAEGKGKEIIEQWQEAVTGISYDSFYNEFIDTLSDMDSSAADMAENFGDYLRKSILAAMVAKEFQRDIDNLYQMWVDAGGENSDKGAEISEDEARRIQEEQRKLTEAMIKKREEMEKTYGWQSSSSQDSTKGGFAAMSQDTGEELNGRFTALQVSNEDIKNSMLSMLAGVNLISTTTANNGITLMEIRNLAISSNSYLEDIAGFQKRIVNEFGSKLDSINDNIKKAL